MQQPGIVVSPSSLEISVRWKDLFFGIGEAAIATALAVSAPATLLGLAKGALDGLKAFRATETVESRAFALMVLALALACDRVIAQGGRLRPEKISAAQSIFEVAKSRAASSTYIITREIFTNPSNTEFYKDLREDVSTIIANLMPYSTMMVDECATKLDAAFNHSVFFVIKSRQDFFSTLEEALSNPATFAAEMEFDWSRYRSALVERFNVAPVFGQKEYSVSLSQIYVPLGGRWKLDEEDYEHDVSSDIEAELEDWAVRGDHSDAVRLVFGGPGSGKSSLARSLAAKLATRSDVRPILIELQHTNALGDLRQAIEQRLVQEGEWFKADPLAQKDDHRPFVLIFDGLDELVVPGTAAASRVSDSFVVALKALMRSLNVQGRIRARAVVTGRSAIMHSFAKAYDVPSSAAIEVLGFLYEDFEDEGSRAFDKRPEWWSKFAQAYGHDQRLPPALSEKKLNDITNEPLLCFLMGMSGYMTENWAEAADNSNRIYAKLIGEVWERKWGQGEHATSGRVGPALKLQSKDDFDLLMETLALAAWWGGENRVATKQMFEKALDVTRAHEVWKSFREDDGDEMQNLALMFYMRKSEIDSQGIEFTHKTFSEYLVARFMMRFAHQKISKLLSSRDIDLVEAAGRWCGFAVQSRCDGGVIRFLKNEARLLDLGSMTVIHEMMAELLSYAHKFGLPVHNLPSSDFRALVDSDTKGKVNALAVLSSVTYALRGLGEDRLVRIDWGDDRTGSARFIGGLVDYRGAVHSEDLEFPNFDFTAAEGSFCTCLFACGADFSGANFDGAMLYKAFLSNCNFENANLSGVRIERADLGQSNLRMANLSNVNAKDSILYQANMEGAIVDGMDLSRAALFGATLEYGWWDAVKAASFIDPPKGNPNLYCDGEIINEEHPDYPDMAQIILDKQKEAEELAADDIPF